MRTRYTSKQTKQKRAVTQLENANLRELKVVVSFVLRAARQSVCAVLLLRRARYNSKMGVAVVYLETCSMPCMFIRNCLLFNLVVGGTA
jgi:L-arabinose isomerase